MLHTVAPICQPGQDSAPSYGPLPPGYHDPPRVGEPHARLWGSCWPRAVCLPGVEPEQGRDLSAQAVTPAPICQPGQDSAPWRAATGVRRG